MAMNARVDAIDARRPWIPAVTVPEQWEDAVHVLLWQARGDADLTVGEETLVLSAGTAVWIPVGTRHRFTVHTDSVTMPLFFDAARWATTLDRPTLVTVDDDLRALMLAYTVAQNTIVKPGANLARQILSFLEAHPPIAAALPMPASTAARSIAESLRFTPGDLRSVDELAESVHASTRTIERAFRSETGMTLRRWRIRNRMEAASVLLRAGSSPDAVAHRVGYTSVNAFRRVFREHVGMSPTAYRSRFRGS